MLLALFCCFLCCRWCYCCCFLCCCRFCRCCCCSVVVVAVIIVVVSWLYMMASAIHIFPVHFKLTFLNLGNLKDFSGILSWMWTSLCSSTTFTKGVVGVEAALLQLSSGDSGSDEQLGRRWVRLTMACILRWCFWLIPCFLRLQIKYSCEKSASRFFYTKTYSSRAIIP